MISFYRLSGGGNDFLALVEPAVEPTPAAIRSWCTRGLSAGADGLFVLRRSGRAARMDYYNADGAAADLCINGTRCAARLALELGWAGQAIVVETGAGAVPARRTAAAEIALELPAPAVPAATTTVEVAGEPVRGWRVDAGVPHFVTVWPRPLGEAPVARLGPLLRGHAALGQGGANIDFVRYPDRRRLEIRTWERGVEGETLACGSGVLAATAVGLAAGHLESPIRALTAGGFELAVETLAGGRMLLAGDARIVAEGRLTAEASAQPEPPRWS